MGMGRLGYGVHAENLEIGADIWLVMVFREVGERLEEIGYGFMQVEGVWRVCMEEEKVQGQCKWRV